MTEKKPQQQQQSHSKARAKATELKDEQLDQANGGYSLGASDRGSGIVRPGGIMPAGYHGDIGDGTGI